MAEEATVEGRYSVERLLHCQCGACGQWWTIGDGDEWLVYRCPRCGKANRLRPAPPVEGSGRGG